jgi:glycosidase
MKKLILIPVSLFPVLFSLFAQDIYPTHWWAGMKNQKLQLMIHEAAIGNVNSVKTTYPGVSIIRIHHTENKNYLFIDLNIASTAKPGKVKLQLKAPGMSFEDIVYDLKPRSNQNGITRVKGVTSADVVYLIMPDRFSNGDPSNDFFNDMRDTGHDRNNPFDRHGGDLLGIQNQLDYLNDLGVTTVWMTPVNENDMSRTQEGGVSRSTYHGYAFTDQYTIDRRLGGNEAYKNLVNAAHAKGMKIVQDAVYNHIGNDHWSFRDLPMKDWVNQWPAYTNTSYKDQPLVDPYAAEADKKVSVDGWFTPFLVDLNQRNPFVSTFLIQYAIWATEEFGIDGWRVDTYFYSDPVFLNKINTALLKEFPKITVFGEAWVQSVTNSAYFCENNMDVSFKHNCQGVTDFPFLFSAIDALNQPFGWNEGVNRLYQALAQDLLYKNPMRNCIFLSNHDLDRIYSVVGEDLRKFKMGMALLLTQRGIPQLYYGDEILMKNFKNPSDAEVRKDFPGGWPGDAVNKFVAEGRTALENEAFNYIRTFARFRKNSSALKTGKLMQFLPQNGVYVYFRYDARQTVMCVMNTNKEPATINLSRFAERMNGFTKAFDVATGVTFNLESTLTLGEKYLLVMELKK